MDYMLVKTLHILSATFLFGTGIGSAFYMWRANQVGELRLVAGTARQVVIADWIFTTPTVIFQPVSGAWLVWTGGFPWDDWVAVSIGLYVLAGVCWLPVVWLQIRMRDIAADCVARDVALPETYWRFERMWFWLGIPAFLSMVVVFFLMVLKPY